jgi:hypothetical protein
MGEQTGRALWARPSIWKSAIVIAPLAATALFLASATQAQTSGNTTPPSQAADTATVAPNPAPAAARRKGRGPKEKMGEEVGRTATPTTTTDPTTPAQTGATVAPIDAPDAARRGGPKGGGRDKEMTGRTAAPDTSPDPATPTQKGATVAPIDAPDAARKEGPKGRSDSGRTEAAPEPDSAPVEERRREGPKGDGGSGRTEAPAPDTQPAGRRREGPKGAVDHGRTSTTPLIIGALGTAAVLALVISSGNDRPASP